MQLNWSIYDEEDGWDKECFPQHKEIDKWVASFPIDKTQREKYSVNRLGDLGDFMYPYEVKFEGTYTVKFPKVMAPDDRAAIFAALREFSSWVGDICGLAAVKVTID